MKLSILLLAGLMVAATQTNAEKIRFKSNEEAVSYIQTICDKYWGGMPVKDQTSKKVRVSQQGCNLMIEETCTFNRGSDPSKTAAVETKTVLVNVNMVNSNMSPTFTNIELVGNNSITSSTKWTLTVADNKNETLPIYILPLTYDNAGISPEIKKMKAAFNYLLGQCNPTLQKRRTVFNRR